MAVCGRAYRKEKDQERKTVTCHDLSMPQCRIGIINQGRGGRSLIKIEFRYEILHELSSKIYFIGTDTYAIGLGLDSKQLDKFSSLI